MKAQCPTCGQWLELPGRAATCPNCGGLVTIVVSAAPPSGILRPERGVTYERPAPYETPRETGMPDWVRSLTLIGVIGIVTFALIFWGIWKVTQRLNAPTVATSAPTPPPARPSNPNAGSSQSIFNEQPGSAPAPPVTVATGNPDAPTAPPAGVEHPPDQRPAFSSTGPATAPTVVPRAFTAPAATGDAKPQAVVSDEAINGAILRGAEFLISSFENGKLKNITDDQRVGADALCVLALLHVGQTISDERLNVHNPFLSNALDTLRKMDLPTGLQTYTRSLRVQALAVYNRKEDRSVLEADTRWLISSSIKGCYAYVAPPTGATQPSAIGWDNSNSQYGALGVWAAADAGVSVPLSYWQDVQAHWESCQGKKGGWDYRDGGAGVLSMTSAGVNMLFVANEMISASRPDTQIARPPFSPALQAGLDWMATGDNAVTINSGFAAYALYGMERAGLACGFKLFGQHDWYRELASKVLSAQQQNGAWGSEIDTAFTMLFLARGRHPLMMNKARFVGAWANRPRDVAHLAKFTGREIERPLNWQVINLDSAWTDWMDAPILYLASHEAPIFDESDYDKLRAFVHAGGLLFTNADGDSKEFNQFIELLAMKLFDGEELKELPPDHLIYTALYQPKEKFGLRGYGNANRLFMLHSPTDLAKRWQGKDPKTDRAAFELGANLFIYVTGMSVPRNRLETLAIENISGKPTTTIPIARLKYAGDWDPEPWAWQRMAKWFRRETSTAIELRPTEIEKLSTDVAPIAHLTGSAAFKLSEAQIESLKAYVEAGGVLLIDPCGGAAPVTQSIHDNILARAFPGKEPAVLKPDHNLVSGHGAGMAFLVKAQVKPYVFKVMGQKFSRPAIIESGRGAVIVSDLDITSGLLGTSTLGIAGYEPQYAAKFISNLILWTMNARGGAPAWSTTQPTTAPAETTVSP